ncbi:hypothetical protein PWT90_08274 [Aphanocladium album]|nr:hypothetical protein PWT90_08274 [Aphanocladium album]
MRERIDGSLQTGLEKVVGPSESPPRVLVHGDFSKPRRRIRASTDLSANLFSQAMNNVPVDPKTNELTGLVDSDFASVPHPAEEFSMSLGDLGRNTGGWQGSDHHEGRLEKAVPFRATLMMWTRASSPPKRATNGASRGPRMRR